MLTIRNLNTVHGKIQALWDVNLEVKEREIVALVGANGAGKTTLLDTITGTYLPASGNVEFQGQRIDGKSAAYIVEQGIAHVPQGGRLFSDMTVRENLEMGAYSRHAWRQRTETIEQVCRIFPRLKERENQIVSTLSGGEKQMVAIGRGLMAKPKLLILDEPFSGLDPLGRREFSDLLLGLKADGTTIFMSSHILSDVEFLCDRVSILSQGKLLGVFDLHEFSDFSRGDFELVIRRQPAVEQQLAKFPLQPEFQEKMLRYTFKDRLSAQEMLKAALSAGAQIERFHFDHESLEDFFVRLIRETDDHHGVP